MHSVVLYLRADWRQSRAVVIECSDERLQDMSRNGVTDAAVQQCSVKPYTTVFEDTCVRIQDVESEDTEVDHDDDDDDGDERNRLRA